MAAESIEFHQVLNLRSTTVLSADVVQTTTYAMIFFLYLNNSKTIQGSFRPKATKFNNLAAEYDHI